MTNKKKEELERRHALLQKAIGEVETIMLQTAEQYGPRFKANGAHEAILHEVATRLSKPGRKPRASAEVG